MWLLFIFNYNLNNLISVNFSFNDAVDIMDAEEIPLTTDNSKSGNARSASSGSV